MNNSRIDLTM